MSSSVFYFIEHGGSYFVLFKCKKRKNRHIHLILLYTFDVKVKNKLDVKRDIVDDQRNNKLFICHTECLMMQKKVVSLSQFYFKNIRKITGVHININYFFP